MKHLLFFIAAFFILGCSKTTFSSKWTKETSPAVFVARFETSKGNFDIELTREWSPQAVDRLYQLLKHGFYDNMLFYRVVPNFVVQFGNTDTLITRKWEKFKVPDEPPIKSNLKSYVSFARAGKETRGNDLFVNLRNNQRLDTIKYEGVIGFPVIGKVIQGMEVVEAMYSGYGDKTMDVYDSISPNREKYLALFPKLDSIKRAYILKAK